MELPVKQGIFFSIREWGYGIVKSPIKVRVNLIGYMPEDFYCMVICPRGYTGKDKDIK